MSGWKPIKEYDALAIPPKFATIFWIAELHSSSLGSNSYLRAGIVTTRTFRSRKVTHYMKLEPPK